MELEKKGLILSTITLPGNNQMALDLHCLKQTISNPEISFTLRFYYWEGYWLSIGYHQKVIPPHWEQLLAEEEIRIVKHQIHHKLLQQLMIYMRLNMKNT